MILVEGGGTRKAMHWFRPRELSGLRLFVCLFVTHLISPIPQTKRKANLQPHVAAFPSDAIRRGYELFIAPSYPCPVDSMVPMARIHVSLPGGQGVH